MGNPFVHIDLSTDDVSAAKKFYKKVFDWQFKDMPGMDWSALDVGTGVGGGVGKKQSTQQPTAWTAYVDVADVAKTLEKAKKAGATIVTPAMPVGEMGILGVFADPQGATIGLWQTLAKKPAPAAKKTAAKKTAAKPAKKPAAKKKK